MKSVEELVSDTDIVRTLGGETNITNKFSLNKTSLSMTGMVGSEGDVKITIQRFLERPSEKSARIKWVDKDDSIQEND